MQAWSPNHHKFIVRSNEPSKSWKSSRITPAGTTLMNNDNLNHRRQHTAEDVRACDVNDSRRGLARNQGIIDKRCKAVRGRLYAEVKRRKVQQMIDHLDTLMQKLLESQDAANEKLYDMYAVRKTQLEAQL